ncbi:MAG: sigma-70 family RNA polymerase sigma factor [Vicinamibacterales bacterium]
MGLLAAALAFRPGSAGTDVDDEEDLRRLAAGDGDAAARLYDRHARGVYSLALRIVNDEGDAEDVVQEVFAQAWRQAARYDASRGVVGAWLLMMTRSRAIDKLRSARARPDSRAVDDPRVIEEMPAVLRDAPSRIIDAENARLAQRALAELPLLQRLVIELAYYEGLTQREIAERLEQPLGTVKSRLRLGLLKLRDALAEGRP